MRRTKSQKGITLIALIITIIVLLILAVVAIGAVQNDGIIEYAKNARQEYGVAQDKENSTLGNYLDKLNENAGGSNSGETTGGGNEGGTFASISAANYGDTITYSAGNVTDWKVFYKDDTHLYIITSGYLNNRNMPTGLKMDIPIEDNTYGIYWRTNSYISSSAATITSTVAEKYKLSWLKDNSEDTGYVARAVADLLYVSAWTEKFGNVEKGIEAIGTPTLEMWVASWNEKGNLLGTDKYVSLKTEYNSEGYFVGPITTESLERVADDEDEELGGYFYNVGTNTDGFKDTLYFPYTESISYLLASPSAFR